MLFSYLVLLTLITYFAQCLSSFGPKTLSRMFNELTIYLSTKLYLRIGILTISNYLIS